MTQPADPRMLPAAQRLLALLPSLFRMRDTEQAAALAAKLGLTAPDPVLDSPQGPLTSFLGILGSQFDTLEAEVDALYEDQFIETCADWVVPYIGALVGARIIDVGDVRSARRQVADTIARRRAKGTVRALADLAGDIAAAPAEGIEYRDYVATAFNPDFPRADSCVSVAINGAEGRARLLPGHFDQHSWEARDMREGGRFAYANAGVRIWTTPARGHFEVVPTPVSGGQPGRLRFSPLGRDIALWRLPDPDDPQRSRLSADEVAGPIPLADAVDRPGHYYGRRRSIAIETQVGTTLTRITNISFCDLSDRDVAGTQWNQRGTIAHPTLWQIDPLRGRLLLPGGGVGVDVSTIRLHYYYGQAIPAGGGDFVPPTPETGAPRPRSFDPPSATATNDFATALADLVAQPWRSILFGGTIDCPAVTALPAATNARLWSGDGVWPTLRIAGSWVISSGAGARLELRGLRLFGGDIIIEAGGITELLIADCTLDPKTTRLVIRDSACAIKIERSVTGPLQLVAGNVVTIADSVIDSNAADTPAINSATGQRAGTLTADRVTFIGDIRLLGFAEVSDCLFAVRPGRTATTPPVDVERTQSGCLRFSALPPGSRTPRRYRCYPAHGDPAPLPPVFASLDYDSADYATLIAANADGILFGAENGGEMGVMNRLSWHRRAQVLNRELPEWVPFGMATATELMRG